MTATRDLKAGQLVRPPRCFDPALILSDPEVRVGESFVRVHTSTGWVEVGRFAEWEEVVEC